MKLQLLFLVVEHLPLLMSTFISMSLCPSVFPIYIIIGMTHTSTSAHILLP